MRKKLYGHEICYDTRRYGRNAVFYWLNEIDGKELRGDPFPDRQSFMEFVRDYDNYKKRYEH